MPTRITSNGDHDYPAIDDEPPAIDDPQYTYTECPHWDYEDPDPDCDCPRVK